jgi:hypothetical protein
MPNHLSVIIIFALNGLLAVVTTIGMTISPLLLVENLGVSFVLLGIIEGLFEMSSNFIKLLSGIVFDKIKDVRKLFFISVLLSLMAKLFLFFPTTWNVLFSKGCERISNGMFATPRDAYILENTTNKGLSYGLLNASKTVGCILGPLLVSLLVYLSNRSIVQNIPLILGVICVLLAVCSIILIFVKSNTPSKSVTENSCRLSVIKNHLNLCFKNKKMITALFPIYLSAFLFFVGRYNDGVLMFYLKDIGAPEWLYLSTISIFNAAMFIVAPILGKLIDKNYAKIVFNITVISLIIFNLIFINLSSLPSLFVFIGLAIYGVQRVGAGIIFAYLVFQKSDNKAVYGANLGLLMFTIGIGNLIGSIVAGYFSAIDFKYVFMFSSVCSIMALATSRYIK